MQASFLQSFDNCYVILGCMSGNQFLGDIVPGGVKTSNLNESTHSLIQSSWHSRQNVPGGSLEIILYVYNMVEDECTLNYHPRHDLKLKKSSILIVKLITNVYLVYIYLF